MSEIRSSCAREIGLVIIKTITLACVAGIGAFVLTTPLQYDQYRATNNDVKLTVSSPDELYIIQDTTPYPTEGLPTPTPYSVSTPSQGGPNIEDAMTNTPEYVYTGRHLVELEPRLINASKCAFGLLLTVPPFMSAFLGLKAINYLKRKIYEFEKK